MNGFSPSVSVQEGEHSRGSDEFSEDWNDDVDCVLEKKLDDEELSDDSELDGGVQL